MSRLALMWVLLSVALCGFVYGAETAAPPTPPPQPPPHPSPAPFPLAWVQLVPMELVKDALGKKWYVDCLTAEIFLREQPDDTSKQLGIIRAKIVQDHVSVEFQAEGAASPTPFTPDLYADGRLSEKYYRGSHPWCHQTVVCRKGDWVQVPPRPWSKAGWINVKAHGLSVRPLVSSSNATSEFCTPYDLDGESFIVFGYTDGGLCVGAAGRISSDYYPKDVADKVSSEDMYESAAPWEIKWERLVDPEGRLRLKLANKPTSIGRIKEVPHPNMGWIGLFDPDWDKWLNDIYHNEIEAGCKGLQDEEYLNCVQRVIDEKKLEKRCELPVHESPDAASPKLGSIIMRVRDNVYAEFRAEGSDKSVELWPDESADRGWWYSINFHQTYLDKKGTWYKLPAKPLPKPGWVDMSLITKTPDDRKEFRYSYIGLAHSIMVLGPAPDGSGLCVRDETAWDHGCGQEFTDEDLFLEKVRVISWKDLLDKDGHLLLHNPYTRGC